MLSNVYRSWIFFWCLGLWRKHWKNRPRMQRLLKLRWNQPSEYMTMAGYQLQSNSFEAIMLGMWGVLVMLTHLCCIPAVNLPHWKEMRMFEIQCESCGFSCNTIPVTAFSRCGWGSQKDINLSDNLMRWEKIAKRCARLQACWLIFLGVPHPTAHSLYTEPCQVVAKNLNWMA